MFTLVVMLSAPSFAVAATIFSKAEIALKQTNNFTQTVQFSSAGQEALTVEFTFDSSSLDAHQDEYFTYGYELNGKKIEQGRVEGVSGVAASEQGTIQFILPDELSDQAVVALYFLAVSTAGQASDEVNIANLTVAGSAQIKAPEVPKISFTPATCATPMNTLLYSGERRDIWLSFQAGALATEKISESPNDFDKLLQNNGIAPTYSEQSVRVMWQPAGRTAVQLGSVTIRPVDFQSLTCGDTTKPEITELTMKDGTTIDNTQPLKMTAYDAGDGLKIMLLTIINRTTKVTALECAVGELQGKTTHTLSCGFSSLPNGQYTATGSVTDMAGNTQELTPVRFTVNQAVDNTGAGKGSAEGASSTSSEQLTTSAMLTKTKIVAATGSNLLTAKAVTVSSATASQSAQLVGSSQSTRSTAAIMNQDSAKIAEATPVGNADNDHTSEYWWLVIGSATALITGAIHMWWRKHKLAKLDI